MPTTNTLQSDGTPANGQMRLGGSRGAGPLSARPASREAPSGNGGSGGPEAQPEEGTPTRRGRETRLPEGRGRRKAKMHLKVATLNIKGWGAQNQSGVSEKWLRVNQIIREKKIAILAVQEAHLNQDRVTTLNDVFGRNMVVVHSADPANGTGARGVAFVVNKRVIKKPDFTVRDLIPGRAMLLEIAWTSRRKLTLVNVYAPNVTSENAEMWRRLEAMRLSGVDIMLGDFNLVEDSLDRLPMKTDPGEAVNALMELKRVWRMSDGWRQTHMNQMAFTYQHTNGTTQSRLDRIYATRAIRKDADNWDLEEPGVDTDHRLAFVEIADRDAPFVGKGRWIMPQHLLRDDEMKATMKQLAGELVHEIDSIIERTAERNPQTAYTAFKLKLMKAARKRAKVKIPKIQRQLDRLRNDRDDVLRRMQHLDACTERQVWEDLQRTAAILQDRITRLERKRFETARKTLAMKCKVNSETLTKEWIRANYTPPDFEIEAMRELRDGEGPNAPYTSNTKKMTEIARKHYDSLQCVDPVDESGEEYVQAVRVALEPAEARLSNRHKAMMAAKLTREEILGAIKSAATNKSPGLDGLQSEVWKEYVKWQEQDARRGESGVDMVKALTAVFNDIAEFGTGGRSILCAPITLLNSDYKLMTRALAMRLAGCASEVIHPDQAGFVPGRSIYDHIRLASLTMDYAEAEEVNGAVVALDQEKAYDRIGHKYLYAALKHMNFPRNFIRVVQNLYADAESCVIINGAKSLFYRITRGVRQGDPLSCLLFDLAIEPLAAALRTSSLRGLCVPGMRDRLVAKLFADDTTAFLSEHDNYGDLVSVLDRWCKGSRAKFNVGKTEIIPVGTPQYRQRVVATRSLGGNSLPFPCGARIAKDGESVRVLGAWIGNGASTMASWSTVTALMRKNLDRWTLSRPTLRGKKLVISMEIGGRTQFLAKAQGMPPEVECAVEKLISDFVWGVGKRAMVAKDTLMLRWEEGGIGMLDIKARNEAIELIWLKAYLNLSDSRPAWAYMADVLMARAIMAEHKRTESDARVNAFLQTWTVSTRAAAGLPDALRRMVKVAVKYGVQVDVPSPGELLKKAMPVWYHVAADKVAYGPNSISGKCLRSKHGVNTVGQCAQVAGRLTSMNTEHVNRKECQCRQCMLDRIDKGCDNPARCTEAASRAISRLYPKWRPEDGRRRDGLSLTSTRKEMNAVAREEDGRILFDPSIAQGMPLAKAFRVFTSRDQERKPARRPPRVYQVVGEEIEVYTDGSCVDNGKENARAGSGVWFGAGDVRNASERVPGSNQSNQTGEFYAVIMAHKATPPFVPMHIVSDSKYVVNGLTKWLPRWESVGWIGVQNAEVIRAAVAYLRSRCAPTTLRWVKGHAGTEGNEGADALAARAAEMDRQYLPVALPPPTEYLREGAELAELTQKVAYAGIREVKSRRTGPRKKTSQMVTEALQTARNFDGSQYREEALWRAISGEGIDKRVRDFIWKMAHGAHRVGDFWNSIPGYEDRAICKRCGVTESMDHVLFECAAAGQARLWMLTRSLLRKRRINLPENMCAAFVIGAPACEIKNDDGKRKAGDTRLLHIAVTETAYLAWKMRCERVIGWEEEEDREHTVAEIGNRWAAIFNNRIALDQAMTSVRLAGKRAIAEDRVRETWIGTLSNEQDLPADWAVRRTWVLVGRPDLAPNG
ncbi:hypothetical protein ONZ51_g163 [Trametes cubensis]|uniref:RNase H type-1 domain-containing protein n=1 Tax=Trametes cubensis TaxID=1111947 RepID=A0AAD7U4G1_9APHY|nr:hypothetical protein ONZ51_g163 [Trametes cubensis]